MATDATGTPTPLGIPTYDTAVDAPSGNGFNAAMSEIDTLLQARATTASPAFTGTPTAPTPAPGDNSTNIATTGFVDNAISSGGYAPLASPAFTGTPTAPTPTTSDNSTKVATTAFVKAQAYLTTALTSFNGRSTAAAVPTSGDYTAAMVTNAADKSSGANQVFTAGLIAASYQGGNSPQTVNGTNSFTPIVDTYSSAYITHTGGGTLTIANPGHFPGAGNSNLFTLTVTSSAAGTTMAWGNAYKFGSGLVINNTLTAGQTQTWVFMMVGDESQAICLLCTGTF